MKINNKKVIVSTLALAMGAALAGSISGSVAWYQYSTRASAVIAGTTAGTSRNLQIAKNAASLDWKQHIDLGSDTFKPVSVVVNDDSTLTFVNHPVYKTAVAATIASAELDNYIAQQEFVFKVTDTTGKDSADVAQVAKDIYLSDFSLANTTTSGANADILNAVRVGLLDKDGKVLKILSLQDTPTVTKGELDLNDDGTNDKEGLIVDDATSTGATITYKNATGDGKGESYATVKPDATSGALVGTADPYAFTNKTNNALVTTKTSGASDALKVVVWLEGWALLGSPTASADWDLNSTIEQNFSLGLQFACEADKA